MYCVVLGSLVLVLVLVAIAIAEQNRRGDELRSVGLSCPGRLVWYDKEEEDEDPDQFEEEDDDEEDPDQLCNAIKDVGLVEN